MAIFMEFEGIEGNVTAEGFAKQIQLESMQWGAGRALTMETGRMSNREATRPSLSEVSVTKLLDKATPMIFEQSCIGKEGRKVIIRLAHTNDELETYIEYTLTDCLIASYSVSAAGDADPMENISLSYSSLEINYIDQNNKNANKGATRWGYSVEKGKKL